MKKVSWPRANGQRLRVEQLRALRDKYERMLSLREAHARARAEPSFVEPDPRPAMMRLAKEYPGALREIDMLPLDVIVARIDALAEAEVCPARAERWMIAQDLFHTIARGALATKRWLRGRKTIGSTTRDEFLTAVAEGELIEQARAFADELTLIARPPRGRLMDLVYEKVAAALGVSSSEAQTLVFEQVSLQRERTRSAAKSRHDR